MIRRHSLAICVLLSLMIAGYAQSVGNIDRSLIAKVMDWNANASQAEEQKVAEYGDKALPAVIGEIRKHPDDAGRRLVAWNLMLNMVALGAVEPDARYIRSVLLNRKESIVVRASAAQMLRPYTRSESVLNDLMRVAGNAGKARIIGDCLGSITGIIMNRSYTQRNWRLPNRYKHFYIGVMRSPDPRVRIEVCSSARQILWATMDAGIQPRWCKDILMKGAHDKEYAVRKSAMTELLRVKQQAARNRTSHMRGGSIH